ncbi:MAG: propanediol/glycerol family dehydratase large subunit [Desulfobacterales bacterium]|nr:propanediol/glycerol family dehydratase large subunit [Desulfobacterales bacterium]
MSKRSKRYEYYETLEVNKDTFIHEIPEIGLKTMSGPDDPKPSIRIVDGRIVEMDNKPDQEFDLIDKFIAKYAIDPDMAEEAMAVDSLEFARKIIDINVPRSEIVRFTAGMTPAKLVEIVSYLNPVEIMMAVQKMRTRKTPANQAHVCNRKDDPALLAADAAVAALTGFDEIETTVGVSRHALSTALGILIGSQIGRQGVLTQCSVEELLELSIGMRGFTTYAETLSVYGTEKVFQYGDDSPWSKMFLTSAYLSRGIKNRFTSGSGSEALMGEAEGKSMLYLEARCIAIIRGAGCQGVQNGGIDCVYISSALPSGHYVTMAENLIAMLWDLECASGCDGIWSGSKTRNAAHMLPWIITGTDYIHSGFGATSIMDNMFGGAGFNVQDLDDEIAIQRDFKVDATLKSLTEEEHIQVRSKAARAIQILCEELDLPRYTDEQIEKVIYAHSSDDIDRNMNDNIRMSEEIIKNNITLVDLLSAFLKAGENEIAEQLLGFIKQRIAGDYLQTAAIFKKGMKCLSAVNDNNDYAGPGTGYRLGKERWEEIKDIRQAISPDDLIKAQSLEENSKGALEMVLEEVDIVSKENKLYEVVIGISPAFGKALNKTLSDLYVGDVIYEILAGIEEEGINARIIRVENSTDLGMIGSIASKLSGSGVAIGIQSKGTTVIQHKDLPPLDNLELFSIAPLLTLDKYRKIGKNAALYAKGKCPSTVPVSWNDEMLVFRTRAFPKVVMLQQVEEESVDPEKGCTELKAHFNRRR